MHCGSSLPVAEAQTRQPQAEPERKPGHPRRNRRRVIALSIAILITALIVASAAALLLWPEHINGLFEREDHGEFSLEPRAADGTVSGSYRPPDNMGSTAVLFSVSPEGHATFRLKDAPLSETLTVALSDERTASMTWAGVTFDGFGALTADEQEAMDTLLHIHHSLLNALELIPLDIACLGKDVIDDKQIAALLFPVQMRLKYTNPNRRQTAVGDTSLSTCDYSSREENRAEYPSVIQYTPAMPVPVVHGYFPFDKVGALEAPESLVPWSDIPCLNISPVAADAPAAVLDEWGPCNAMCRGACGPDCTLNNCTVTKVFRCEKDEQGRNTEMGSFVFRYECGLHEGCIEHDACYDRCNATFGCGTWAAAYCRHGRVDAILQAQFGVPAILADAVLSGYEYCDEAAWVKYGTLNTALWVRGYGSQPISEVFEYTDPTYGLLSAQLIRDPGKCPGPTGEAEEAAQTADDLGAQGEGEEGVHSLAPATATPNATATPAPTARVAVTPTPRSPGVPSPMPTPALTVAPTATPGLLVWVRQEPAVVNVNNDPLEVQALEPRFVGSFTKITPGETSFTTQERYVDHEVEYYNFSITCNFDTPPLVLNPGLRYSLNANCSHGGTHTSGGEGMGEQFWYSAQSGYQGFIDPPTVLAYYPWSPNFDGTNSKEWMVTAPPVNRPGDTFQIYASMWNRPPCNVTWTYRAEYH